MRLYHPSQKKQIPGEIFHRFALNYSRLRKKNCMKYFLKVNGISYEVINMSLTA
jgi:hypothetical protein